MTLCNSLIPNLPKIFLSGYPALDKAQDERGQPTAVRLPSHPAGSADSDAPDVCRTCGRVDSDTLRTALMKEYQDLVPAPERFHHYLKHIEAEVASDGCKCFDVAR